MAQITNCLKLISRINEGDQDSLISRIDELQALGVPAQRAQVQVAIDVLARLQAGADFDQMASQYSLDGSGADGGDMGWDSVNPLPDEYQEALDQLEPGEISGIVSSQFGYHIILCTERYVPTYHEDGSLDLEAIPPSLFDYIREQMRLTSGLLAYQAYMQTLESDADIVIYD